MNKAICLFWGATGRNRRLGLAGAFRTELQHRKRKPDHAAGPSSRGFSLCPCGRHDVRRSAPRARFPPHALGLTVLTKPCDHGEDSCQAAECEPFVITTRGPDRKGLVAHISGVIAATGSTSPTCRRCSKRDDPGDNIMIYEVDVPKAVDLQALAQDCGTGPASSNWTSASSIATSSKCCTASDEETFHADAT